jgi:hypothetical protein
MIALYCDAAGKESSDAIAVGGFVSTVDEWLEFDKKWRAVLGDNALDYFRMSEFAHSTGQFAHGWKGREEKRALFIGQLVDIIAEHTKYWMGACVLKRDYDRVDRDYELHERTYPFPLCARGCIDGANAWYHATHQEGSIEYIFEYGDDHFDQLKRLVQTETGIIPIERKKRDVTPCQAADFAAYEVLYAYRFLEIRTHKLFEKWRGSFRRLNGIPAKWGQFEEKDLRVLCRMFDYPRR